MEETYRTLEAPCTGEFRDRGSKFLAYAFPLNAHTEWAGCLESVRKEHPKATHHCYAYRIGFDGNQFRANDDGEPSGTAGKPILGQIDSFRLSNVLVVVVRYFGGTLLGAGGLVQAYKTAAAAALGNGAITERAIEETFELAFHYALMNDVMNALKKTEARFVAQDFGDSARVRIAFPRARTAENFLRLKAFIAKVHLEEAALLGDINGLQIQRIEEGKPG
ncbi:MAG: IMPACT family protein [Saprospiraceae bacterium]|jgi:uncharacterized YigZ family protein